MKKLLVFLKKIFWFGIFTSFIFIFQYSGCEKSVSVTPPDKPPPNGFIYIDSYPKKAHIFLNGHARRRATPDSITWLKTRIDTFTLKKELFRDTSFIVNIVEGTKQSIFIDYTKNPLMLGNINCTSKPSKAYIFINDSSTGLKTPATIKGLLPGYYNVTCKLEYHLDNTNVVTVSSSNTSYLYSVFVDTTIWTNFNTGNSEIASDKLNCITIDNNNKIWIGSLDQGIILYDGNQWLNYTRGSTRLPDNKINSIITIRKNNNVLAGTDAGMAKYYSDGPNDLKVYRPPFYPTSPVGPIAAKSDDMIALAIKSHIVVLLGDRMDEYYPTSLNSSDFDITAMMYGAADHIWIGTKNGEIAQRLGDEWIFYNSFNSSIYSNQITALAIDDLGTVWVGYSSSDRLSYYDGTSWKPSIYTSTSARYKVNSIYVDAKERLWVGTNNGLLKIEGASIIFYNYDITGLNLKNVSGATVDKNGYIWITTYDSGLFRFRGAD